MCEGVLANLVSAREKRVCLYIQDTYTSVTIFRGTTTQHSMTSGGFFAQSSYRSERLTTTDLINRKILQ
jgi:hypothetical protein